MDKNKKHTIIGIAAVIIIVGAVFIGIYTVSGVSSPQTVISSQSMQHSPNNNMHSQIGIIDTGDMVIVRDKGSKDDNNIQSFVDGYKNGYSKFGNFGDVIIYDRVNDNSVIHRAILWLEYNDKEKTWSAPSFEGYPSELWSCVNSSGESITDYNRLSGVLRMYGLGPFDDRNYPPSVNLDDLYPHSGFLTKGDHNTVFDTGSVIGKELVTFDRIESVTWFEIPWIGSLKLIMEGEISKLDALVPNSVPSLAAAIISFIFILMGITFLFDQRYYKKYRKEMYKDMNALPPSFPVEEKNNNGLG